ncbi:hypothetical protein AMS68_007479 [Peltaster fructicola]|uniref:Zn(2)-C6 fungal-type domain-containing protein n=1 Tax=Peltaster fructicola TaxID=286661 RepID=A0A6H0Y4K7_9PEZI|nr:hypothetical protein AMS68_007479 [Peltaster fructicola]
MNRTQTDSRRNRRPEYYIIDIICRQRRVKCDRAKPACGNCVTRGVSCPGYRDVNGFFFVDSSQQIAERQSRLASKSNITRTSPPRELSVDENAVALVFFFSEFVLNRDAPSILSMTHFDHLIPLYLAADRTSPLAPATTLLARLALNAHQGTTINPTDYAALEAKACQKLRTAIAKPTDSVRDETLMAVLCLDYAAHLSSTEGSLAACRDHVDGAVALVQHRGPESFDSTVARSLYAATRSNALLQGLWSNDKRSIKAIVRLPKVETGSMNVLLDLQQKLVDGLTLEQEILEHAHDESRYQSMSGEAFQLNAELQLWWTRMPPSLHSIVQQPRVNSYSEAWLEGASVLCSWYCIKVLVLKMIYATTTPERRDCKVFAEMTHILAGLSSLLEAMHMVDVTSFRRRFSQSIVDRRSSTRLVLRSNGPPIDVSGATWVQQILLSGLRWVLNELQDLGMPRAEEWAAHHVSSTHVFKTQLDALLASLEQSSDRRACRGTTCLAGTEASG